jgi:urease accessory protein
MGEDEPNTPLRVVEVRKAEPGDRIPFDLVIMFWHERRHPRGVFECVHGDLMLIDLPVEMAVTGMRLFFTDGRNVEVIAGEEDVTEITAPDLGACLRLLLQAGIPTQSEPDRLRIARNHPIEAKLHALGATLRSLSEPFEPDL